MSDLHSETNDRSPGLTVRVKFVNLNEADRFKCAPPFGREASAHAPVIAGWKRGSIPRPWPAKALSAAPSHASAREVCMLSGQSIPTPSFETHIETCLACANRVELQLDFMETLEAAVYQRLAEPKSDKVRGAMLVSAPEMNFAVCGELEVG